MNRELNNSIKSHVIWKAFSIFFLFVLNVLFARYYAATATGWVFYLFTVNAFIVQVFGMSLESGVAYYTARKSVREGRLINFSLIWTVLVSLITMGLYLIYSAYYPERVEYPILYPIAFVAGNMLISFGNAIFYSKRDFVTPNILSLIVNVLLIGMLIFSFEYSKVEMPMAFIPVYFYSFLVHGLALFLLLFVFSKEENFLLNLNSRSVSKVFKYSVYAFAANLLFLGLTRIDYFFIRRFCSGEDLGNYIQVSKISQLFFLLPSMISTVLFPFVASGEHPEVKKRINNFSLKLLMLYAGACAVIAATGYWLFPIVYGPTFSNMYVPFLFIIPGILAISGLYPFTAYFSGENRIIVNIRGTFLGFIFILIADYLFIPKYGINAAALISSVGYFIYYCYVFMVFKKETRVEKNSLANVLVSQQT